MQKLADHCTAVLSRVIFIGSGIQIVLGAIWMCNAFARLGGFGEGIVCVGKFLLFLCAVFSLLKIACGASCGAALFGSLSVSLFPMILQCCFAEGMQSAAAALLLLETAGILRVLRMPKKKKQLFFWVPVLAVTVGMMAGMGNPDTKGGNALECLASRFAWTVLTDTYDSMPEEWQGSVDRDKVFESSFEAVGMDRILIPYLKETLGEKRANAFLREMIKISWRQNRTRIAKEMVWDLAGYLVSPVVLQLQLKGRAYDSYSGFNYRQLLIPDPKLGKNYLDYGCWWFQVSLVLSVILWIVKYVRGFRLPDKKGILLIFLVCGCLAVINTMSGAGKMDYKNTIYILCMWLTGILYPVIRNREFLRSERKAE